MTHAGCRIRSARDKRTGFVLHVLQNQSDRARVEFLREMADLVDNFHSGGAPLVGYAVVLWAADGAHLATLRAGQGSAIPSIAMPEFVKNCVLAAKIEEWARQ